jgi:proteasome lid subunit RPN8/RPN11
MNTEVWDKARQMLSQSMQVVGWYHSHPNLGAFFSGTDRTTQRGFFGHPYSVGLVVDPVRNEKAWFLGPGSTSLAEDCVKVIG